MLKKVIQSMLFMILFSSLSLGQDITYESLLKEMTDRSVLAQWPEFEYRAKQASSYDRNSKSDDQDGWFANRDFNQFIRCDTVDGRKEWVMMDESGPGSIVRIWMTGNTEVGNIRVYLDGQDTPVIVTKPMNLVGGTFLVGPPLSAVRSKGRNLYLPISFNKGCKITYDGYRSYNYFYYQIGYRLYDNTVDLETFAPALLDSLSSTVAALQNRLLSPQPEAENPSYSLGLSGIIKPGESMVKNISGSRAIKKINLKLDAANFKQALRSTILSISFDGQETVWCPVGDFFGSGRGFNPYSSWWMEVNDDSSMACYWVMPFENNCAVKLINLSQQPLTISAGEIALGDWEWTENSLYFHGTWHMDTAIETLPEQGSDWNYITIDGKGIYVGDVLSVHNNGGGWWGEGDEKIFVDADTFPSFFGTGTEDYYGYAWCWHEFFEAPFHAQPTGKGNPATGFSTNLRTRSLGAIPFNNYFNFDMEMWHWKNAKMQYATSLFWYGAPGASCNYQPDVENAKRSVFRTSSDFLECEILDITGFSGGAIELQYIPQFNWSENAQVWWRDARPGDSLLVEMPVDSSAEYNININFTKANDYAIASFYLDGLLLKDSIDFYNSSVINTGELLMGRRQLDAGMHQLKVVIEGCNTKALKRYMIGMDYINLTTGATSIKKEYDWLPLEFRLNQNYPNPFNPSTTIGYSIPKAEFVKIDIYNINGQKIQTLLAEQIQAGQHSLTFNAAGCASGIYFCHINAGQFFDVKKMILLQ